MLHICCAFAGAGTKVHVYESGSSKGGFGSFGPETVLEIWLTADNKVQYVDDGHVFYTSTKSVVWPLHAGAVVHTVQAPAFERIEYVHSLPGSAESTSSSLPPPTTTAPMTAPPPPLPPGDYVIFDGGASADLEVGIGTAGKISGTAGWNTAAWSDEDIWSAEDVRKGIRFRCPVTKGAKMIGFVGGDFGETSSYTKLAYAIYCVCIAS